MDRWTKSYAPLFGRIFMGGFFLWNGIQEILNLSATTQIFAVAGLPEPAIIAIVTASLEVIGGISLVVGFRTRFWAAFLALYILLASTSLFNTNAPAGMQLFLQNMAIVGGLLYISAYGSGKWSSDQH